jgi:hypothetical protein
MINSNTKVVSKSIILLLLLIGVFVNNCSALNQYQNKRGFIENKGQIIDQYGKPNNKVLYLFNGSELNVQLKRCGFSYDLFKFNDESFPEDQFKSLTEDTDLLRSEIKKTYNFHRVDVDLVNANPDAEIIAEDPCPYYSNYYNIIGNPNGITSVREFKKILYKEIYPSIDIEFTIDEVTGQAKYSFIVRPGGKIENIKLKYNGVVLGVFEDDKQPDNNNLQLFTSLGTIIETIPESYMILQGKQKKEAKIKFSQVDNNTIGFMNNSPFTIGISDILVIDPSPERQWGTYYGGSKSDNGYDVVTDSYGNVCMIGSTTSLNNIATSGAYQDTILNSSYDDIYIVKFDSTGNRIWGTYFGGENMDFSPSMAIDLGNNLFITGVTESQSNIATIGAYQEYGTACSSTGWDAFIEKFNSNGFRIWGTYFGGEGDEFWNSIAVDEIGGVYICGNTDSDSCISTPGAQYETYGGGVRDAYLAKFDTSGTRLWATYYGGNNTDEANCVTTDNLGNVYIAGMTLSPDRIAAGGFQNINGGCNDAFLAKFNSNGVRLWGTYYGSGSAEFGMGVAAYRSDCVYLAGYTSSSTGIATVGAHQESNAGGPYDGFLVKFSSNGSRIWGTYFGGEKEDNIYKVATNSAGDVIVAGRSFSTTNISSLDSYQDSCETCPIWCDVYMGKFNSIGQRIWSTYYGGEYNDMGMGLTTANNNIYLSGLTASPDNIASPLSFQSSMGSAYDAFLVRFIDTTGSLGLPTYEDFNFSIYPVPTSDLLNINFNHIQKPLDVLITDIYGRNLLFGEINPLETEYSISCRTLCSGIYILNIMDAGKRIAAVKFIKL